MARGGDMLVAVAIRRFANGDRFEGGPNTSPCWFLAEATSKRRVLSLSLVRPIYSHGNQWVMNRTLNCRARLTRNRVSPTSVVAQLTPRSWIAFKLQYHANGIAIVKRETS